MKTVLSLLCLLSLTIRLNAETTASSPAARPRQIRVVDADGRPVAGAVVEGETSYVWASSRAANPHAEWRGVTDDQGRASFTIADEGVTAFVALKAGLAVGWSGWLHGEEKPDGCETIGWIDLTEPASMSGVVKDPEGRPVKDVVVWAAAAWMKDPQGTEYSSRFMGSQQGRKYLTARTGSGGEFKIDGVPRDATLALGASKPGWALERRPLSARGLSFRAGQSGIELSLVPGAVIEGRVVDETTGEPIPGARVWPSTFTDADSMKAFPPTGADGIFRLTDLSPGRVELRAIIGTNAFPEWVCEPAVFELKSGVTHREAILTANRGGFVEVVALTQIGDQPLGNVNVACFGTNSGSDALTTARGLAGFCLRPGRYHLFPTKSGWTFARAPVVCELGKTTRLILKASPSPRLVGVVQDPEGRPAARVPVTLIPRQQLEEDRTDDTGRFSVIYSPQLVDIGRHLKVFFLARDPARNLVAASEIQAGLTNPGAIIVLRPGVTLAGKVIDDQGTGISAARTRLTLPTPFIEQDLEISPATDAEGRFEIRGLPDDWRYRVRVYATGYGIQDRTVEAPDSGVRRIEIEPIVMVRADRRVAGVVWDDDIHPAAGASVGFEGKGQPVTNTHTDDQGRFLIAGVCPGPIQVWANDGKERHGVVSTQGGDTNIVIRLSAGPSPPESAGRTMPRVPGLLLDADGKPAPKMSVITFPSVMVFSGEPEKKTTDGQGRFSLLIDKQTRAFEMKQTVVFALDPARQWAASLDLDEDATNAVLRLEPAWTLAGRVVDAGGDPITNAWAGLRFLTLRLPAPYVVPVATDHEGRFEFRGLPPGRSYTVTLSAYGFSSAWMQVDAPEPGLNRVEVEAVRLATVNLTLEGFVLDAKDQPVNGASVRCLNVERFGNQPVRDHRSDRQGRFLIRGLHPGRVQVSVGDFHGPHASVAAEAGDTQVLLRLVDPVRNAAADAPPRPMITGTVVEANGQPARDIRLVFLPFSQLAKKTDPRGRFLLDPHAEGIGLARTRMVVLALDVARNLAGSLDLDEDATQANLRLEQAWTLSGRVTDAHAAPITNAQARLLLRSGSMASSFDPPVAVDAQGRFTFNSLPPGYPFEVAISAPGYGSSRVPVDAPGEERDRLEMDPIPLIAADLTVGGVVVDDQDRPVRGAIVRCESETTPRDNRLTDVQGRFLIKSVCPGRIHIWAHDYGRRVASIETEGGASNLVLRLAGPRRIPTPNAKSWSRIAGTVVDPDGQPARNLRVTFLPFTQVERLTDTEGRFALNPNPEGFGLAPNRIVAMTTDLARNLAASLDLDDRTTHATLKLEPAWTLSGRVTDANGAALSNAQAQLMFRTALILTNAATVANAMSPVVTPPTSMVVPIGAPVAVDGEGRFVFKGLPQGRAFEVGVSAKGYGCAELKVDAPKAGQNQLETKPIPLPAANLTLGGLVVDDQDHPVRGARVQFHSDRQSGSHRTTDRQGRFLFKGVCPGRLEVTANDFRSRSGTMTAAGGDTNLTVRIKPLERRPVPAGAGPR